jgi:phosphatidylglycerol lysyltransferase
MVAQENKTSRQYNLEERMSPAQRWDLLSPYLKKFGDFPMAYSTLQPGMEYFIDESKGYIAYVTVRNPILAPKGKRLVLANPVCDQKDYLSIIKSFLAQGSSAIFCQIDERVAICLSKLGFKVNRFGTETDLDLLSWDTKGKDKAQVRHWVNKATKEGIEVFEESISKVNQEDLKRVSENWLSRRGGHELSVLTRPLVYYPENDVRYFFGKRKNSLVGVVVFDPIYRNGEVVGYYHNMVRTLDSSPHGTTDLITIKAMEKFRQEGRHLFSFGMSPMSHLDGEEFNSNKITSKIFRMLYMHGNFLYPFKGNEYHKSQYRGNKRKVYFSSTNNSGLVDVLAGMKGLGMF